MNRQDDSHEFEDSYITGEVKSKYPICEVDIKDQPLSTIIGIVDKKRFTKNLDKIAADYYEKKDNKGDITTIIRDASESKPTVTPKSLLKSILTEYIVEDVNMSESEGALIYLLTKLFDGVFYQYEKVYGQKYMLVFKGGNVTRLFFEEMIEEFFPTLSEEAFEHFGKYFKKSDLDFSVENISENYQALSDEEKVKVKYHESNILLPYIWYILNIARLCIARNAGDLYNFCKFNFLRFEQDIKSVISKIETDVEGNPDFEGIKFIGLSFNEFTYMRDYDLEDILENPSRYKFTDAFSDENDGKIPKFFQTGNTRRKDIIIESKLVDDDRNETDIITVDHANYNIYVNDLFDEDFDTVVDKVLPYTNSEFYVSVSTFIENVDDDIAFRLCRLMINFAVIYEKDGKLGALSVPSELYDVGFTIKDPNIGVSYPKGRHFDKYTYSFVDSNDETVTDSILVTSVYAIVLDLIKILFVQSGFPWDDRKYGKRIVRLVIMTQYIELKAPKRERRGFTPDDIFDNYILPVKDKVLNLSDDSEVNKNLREYEKMLEIFISARETIESYIDRDTKREKYVSRLTPYSL